MNRDAMRWTAGLFLVSPLLTLAGYYLLFGLFGTAMGIGMAGGVSGLREVAAAVLMFAVPIAFLSLMGRGYYRYFDTAHRDAPPAILGSLLIAAAAWWAGTGVFLLFFDRTPGWIFLMWGATLAWALITGVAFKRHGRQALWALWGAPFALYAPTVFVIATAMGMQAA